MSLLLVSHDPHSISTNTTYSYLLSHGRIIFEGVSREVSNKYLEISTTTRIKKENRCSLAWGMHVEAINYWYQQSKNCYRNIWVIEDDVGYSGNICNLIEYYNNQNEVGLLFFVE